MILFIFIKGITTWHKNNNSPRLTVSAKIVAKRQNTTHHNQPNAGDMSGAHGYHTTISTTYYVNNKQTSKSKYQAYIKKLSTKKETGIKFSSLKWKRY